MIHTYSQSTADSTNQFWPYLLPDLDVVTTEYFSVTRSLCHNQLSWHMSCDLVLTLSYIEEEAQHSDFPKVTQGMRELELNVDLTGPKTRQTQAPVLLTSSLVSDICVVWDPPCFSS